MIPRAITPKVLELSHKFPVIAITGPRQSGKTTLIRDIFPDYRYFNLENPIERNFALEDPQGFLAQSKKMIIDEIQRVPELFSYIQVMVDDDPELEFVISGSQNFSLNEKISQTLAGRVAKFVLLPFSLRELKNTIYWFEDYKEFFVSGFYPRIYDHQLNPADWYPNYIETYVERDVTSLLNIENKDRFVNFLTSCAANVGNVVNYTSLANSVGISPNTVKSWLSILRQSYLVFTLQPYSTNIKKRLRKSPKLYFYDMGVLAYFLGIKNVENYKEHYLKGQIFENFIISEIIKENLNQYTHKRFFYLRDKAGHEVDLVYEEEGKLNLVEIKSGQTYQRGMSKNLLYYQSLLNVETNNFVLYDGQQKQNRSDFTLLPWQEWFLA
ncbi:MAG: ATP-binding protein [Chloroflexi bacterium]|nr:ATP-binding protein [Chloroflexota bacterium]